MIIERTHQEINELALLLYVIFTSENIHKSFIHKFPTLLVPLEEGSLAMSNAFQTKL